MHKFIMKCFNFLFNVISFLKILSMFCILMLLLYWIQNLTHAHWNWMGFIAPFLDWLLNFTNGIYSMSFQFFGAIVELKYLSALVLLIVVTFLMHICSIALKIIQDLYEGAHYISKKAAEAVFNRTLQENASVKEKQINDYVVTMHTRISNKYAKYTKVNLAEETQKIQDFISNAFSTNAMMFQGGCIYKFYDIERIDLLLKTLFKLINTTNMIEIAICVQVGDNLVDLNKLIDLQNYGKITMSAETAYRYSLNDYKSFETACIGVYQSDRKSFEVHEFKNMV